MALSLQHEVEHLREQVAQLLDLAKSLRAENDRLQAHIARLVKMTFGRSSERVLGPTLFDNTPEVADTSLSAKEEPVQLVPKRKGHGRKKNAAALPRVREELVITEAEKLCPCCTTPRVQIGETTRERLSYQPSSIVIRVIASPTLVCRKCEQAGHDPQFLKPAFPAEPIPKSGLDASLLAHIITSKFIDHLPLYRQVSILARLGWPVSSSRLCDLVRACGVLLLPLYRLMVERVKQSYVIHVHDSPVSLMKPCRSAFAWLYLGDALNPYTVFDFTTGRGQEHPTRFLQGFQGFLQADGYDGYNLIHQHLRHLGCWAHVRRKFVEAQASDPQQASEALAYIRTLYAVEKQIKEEGLTGDKVVSLRQSRAGPILEQFGEWIAQHSRHALPTSPLGRAFTYAQNQWPSLIGYLTDARFAIDNNIAERAVRPLAVGRKNWLFIGGDGGLSTASVLMSVCASAKQHGLNPQTYLTDVLTRLANKPTDLIPLLPDVWAKQQLK